MNDVKTPKTYFVGFDIHKLIKNKKLALGGLRLLSFWTFRTL